MGIEEIQLNTRDNEQRGFLPQSRNHPSLLWTRSSGRRLYISPSSFTLPTPVYPQLVFFVQSIYQIVYILYHSHISWMKWSGCCPYYPRCMGVLFFVRCSGLSASADAGFCRNHRITWLRQESVFFTVLLVRLIILFNQLHFENNLLPFSHTQIPFTFYLNSTTTIFYIIWTFYSFSR